WVACPTPDCVQFSVLTARRRTSYQAPEIPASQLTTVVFRVGDTCVRPVCIGHTGGVLVEVMDSDGWAVCSAQCACSRIPYVTCCVRPQMMPVVALPTTVHFQLVWPCWRYCSVLCVTGLPRPVHENIAEFVVLETNCRLVAAVQVW